MSLQAHCRGVSRFELVFLLRSFIFRLHPSHQLPSNKLHFYPYSHMGRAEGFPFPLRPPKTQDTLPFLHGPGGSSAHLFIPLIKNRLRGNLCESLVSDNCHLLGTGVSGGNPGICAQRVTVNTCRQPHPAEQVGSKGFPFSFALFIYFSVLCSNTALGQFGVKL